MRPIQILSISLLVFLFTSEVNAQVYRVRSYPVYQQRIVYSAPVVRSYPVYQRRIVYTVPVQRQIIYYPVITYPNVIIVNRGNNQCQCPSSYPEPQGTNTQQQEDNKKVILTTTKNHPDNSQQGIDKNGVPIPGGWYSSYK